MKHNRVGLCIAIMALSVAASLSSSRAEGVSNTVQRASAFVFVDGRYLVAPYDLIAREGRIWVNGTNAMTLMNWPPRLVSPEKPTIPASVLSNANSFADLKYGDGPTDNWASLMEAWIVRSSSNTAERVVMLKAFHKSLPFVTNLVDDPEQINEWKLNCRDGSVQTYGVPLDYPKFETLQDVEAENETFAKNYRMLLDKGNSLFFFNIRGNMMWFSMSVMAEKLALMCEVLSSERSNVEKLDILGRMGLIPEQSEVEGEVLISNFRMSAELATRIKELKEATGIVPMGIGAVPSVRPGLRVSP